MAEPTAEQRAAAKAAQGRRVEHKAAELLEDILDGKAGLQVVPIGSSWANGFTVRVLPGPNAPRPAEDTETV